MSAAFRKLKASTGSASVTTSWNEKVKHGLRDYLSIKNGDLLKPNDNSHLDGNNKFWTCSQSDFTGKALVVAVLYAGLGVR